MQRIAGLLALALTAALLVGCAYDPYTGTYAPCCGYYGYPYYGNPYYRYPPPYAPYGYPSGPYAAPPPSQPGAYASPPAQFARAERRSSASREHTPAGSATTPRHHSRASRGLPTTRPIASRAGCGGLSRGRCSGQALRGGQRDA